MGLLRNIVLVILGISFMTFITFFGRLPLFRNTPISFLHRLTWIHLPNLLATLDNRLTSGRITRTTSRTFHYIMYDRHPTVLIFFFLLLSVSESLYLPTAWPHLSLANKLLAPLAVIFPYLFLYHASFADPGVVSPSTHVEAMARYPYDYTLFHPGIHCATCRLLKPARSKHCSVCGACVGRMDHHCVFINNCVGANNTRSFLLLLLSTAVLTLYGGLLGLSILSSVIRARYSAWSVVPSPQMSAYWVGLSYGLRLHPGLGSVTLLSLFTSPLVWGLLCYHLYLVYAGTTTNESQKWSSFQADMAEGVVWKRKMDPKRQKNPRIEPLWTRWPVEAEQVMVRTEDGEVPLGKDLPGVGGWERVWALRDTENLYDLGFKDNLLDVMVPGWGLRGE